MGQKLGVGSAPFWRRGDGSASNTKSPGPSLASVPSGILIDPAVWPQQPWAENWWLCPFEGGGAGCPSNTMWPGMRPNPHAERHRDPPNRLVTIHQRYRETGQDRQTANGPIAEGEPFYKWLPKNRNTRPTSLTLNCHADECGHQQHFTDAAATQKSRLAHHHHPSQLRRCRMNDFSAGLYSRLY